MAAGHDARPPPLPLQERLMNHILRVRAARGDYGSMTRAAISLVVFPSGTILVRDWGLIINAEKQVSAGLDRPVDAQKMIDDSIQWFCTQDIKSQPISTESMGGGWWQVLPKDFTAKSADQYPLTQIAAYVHLAPKESPNFLHGAVAAFLAVKDQEECIVRFSAPYMASVREALVAQTRLQDLASIIIAYACISEEDKLAWLKSLFFHHADSSTADQHPSYY